MAGVVLENLSTRKLVVLIISLFLLLLVFFLIGGLIAPAPANVINGLTTVCVDQKEGIRQPQKWYPPRGPGMCKQLQSTHDPQIDKERIAPDQIVFSALFPLPRNNQILRMSRWFQNMVGVMQLNVLHTEKNPMHQDAMLRMVVRIGYRDEGDDPQDWKELANSTEERMLECNLNRTYKDGELYDCDLLPFFELGSVHHDYYLFNIRLPTYRDSNLHIGYVEDMYIIVIHQNGGFTKVWFSMKTVLFPLVLAALAWFWRRVQMQLRPTNLLERTLFSLGVVLSIMNCPLEWLTLRFDMPYMLLISDIRQGAFYAMLLSFWIIFIGDHTMDQVERNRLMAYWKHLSIVVFGCVCLFIFEMCERGVQLTNPFFTIWSTTTGRRLALGFIILAGVAACSYFLFLCWMVFQVFRNIRCKSASFPLMTSVRRKYYQGLITRFKFLMLTTLLCAALTVIFFIISQVSEGQWKWGDDSRHLEYSSAFLTGVYGMWNVYVLALLALYAPSHKNKPSKGETDPTSSESDDVDMLLDESSEQDKVSTNSESVSEDQSWSKDQFVSKNQSKDQFEDQSVFEDQSLFEDQSVNS